MKYELWYSVVVRDRHGKVISRERRKSKSFLKAWNQLVCVQMRQSNVSITDVNGVVHSTGVLSSNFRMYASIGDAFRGLVVGTGNTPVAIDDYALETKIDNGTGAGQMEYLVCTVPTSVVSAPSCYFVVSRTIANNSPGIITVKEAAIYMSAGGNWTCATRDVFVTPQAVPIGGSITIDWTIQVTV